MAIYFYRGGEWSGRQMFSFASVSLTSSRKEKKPILVLRVKFRYVFIMNGLSV